jgi:hypothetical protein
MAGDAKAVTPGLEDLEKKKITVLTLTSSLSKH